LTKIKDAFQNDGSGIKCVVLIGTGGAGKTTLARQYSRQQDKDVVWELNAETEGKLMDSLEGLAYAISKSNEGKEELNKIQRTEKKQEKIQKIILFIQKYLKNLSGWLIIYDNAPNFNAIKHYFPYDFKNWGEGNIIITTQDLDIIHNEHINIKNVIEVKELTEEEKLNFFIKKRKSDNKKIPYNEKETIQFLENIPSFPLDVSLAANFLKRMDISYEEYLEELKIHSKSFAEFQKDSLMQNGDYNKTRHDIIRLSLETIISKHKDFESILFFIGLLDSQNIPINMLYFYKDKVIVNRLVSFLREYSLVENISSSEKNFSFHRTTQQIISHCLIERLRLGKNNVEFQVTGKTLENYMAHILDQKDPVRMKNLIPHIIVFLSHKNSFDFTTIEEISLKLSQFYFFLGQYEKAKELLEISLSECLKQYGENHIKTASIKRYLGHTLLFSRSYKNAEVNLKESLKIYQKHYGNDHIETALVKKFLGHASTLLGNYKEAKSLLDESLKTHQKHYGDDHIETALVKKYSGYPNVFLGYREEGRNAVEESLIIHQKHYGNDHIETAWVKTHLGRVYTILERYEEAKILIEESLIIHQKHYGNDHIETAWVKTHLGRVYTILERYEEAKALLEESLRVHQKKYGEKHIETSSIRSFLSAVLHLL
jgi:tetratricopeptide (TPR) repeat protein